MSREPIKHTCPDIDRAIRKIKDAYKLCTSSRINENNYKDYLSDIASCLYGIDDALEELRSSNASLRDWGQTEAERVDELEKEVSSLEAQLQNQTTIA